MYLWPKFNVMLLLATVMAFFPPLLANADVLEKDVLNNYPAANYLVGIGNAKKSDNARADKRIAEILARTEIAKQIRVHIKETFIDVACDGTVGKTFKGKTECVNKVQMTIEETVDEFLVGSEIVESGEKGGIIYAIAVLPISKASENMGKGVDQTMEKARENLKDARNGSKEGYEKARNELVKAKVFNQGKESLDGVRGHADDALRNLEEELARIKEYSSGN